MKSEREQVRRRAITAPQHDANAQRELVRPGGFFIRLVAYLVDVTIVFVLTILLASALGFSRANGHGTFDGQLPCRAFDWMFVITYMLYFTVFRCGLVDIAWKNDFGIKVVRNDGSKSGSVGRSFDLCSPRRVYFWHQCF